MSTTLAPISLASTIIGFISFSLTLAIWLHAFWDGFKTLGSAPEETRDVLSTLRQGLYEEREYLRRLKRRKLGGIGEARKSKGGERVDVRDRDREGDLYYEGGPVRVFSDAVKDLINDFKRLEKPFLIPPHEGAKEKELEWSYDATAHHYYCDLPHRISWLRNKGHVLEIARRLGDIQMRRIAVEVADCHVLLNDTVGMLRRCEDRLGGIEHRLQMSQIG